MAKKIDYRKFMQMAIDEMKKSVSEPRNDGRANPKVGAVIVSPDGELLETAYRGELREGDHAEYTLLDKKLRDKNVTGCILFTTLEPCAERARKPPKVECAKRIINARIKKVFVGIEDPDPKVARKGIKFLMASGTEVNIFDKDLQDIIEKENKQYLKEATLRAQATKIHEPVELSPLEKVIETMSIKEFSQDALKHYITRANLNMQPDSIEFLTFLEQQELILSESFVESTVSISENDEFRRNDVKPIFVWQSTKSSSGLLTDKFLNNGDRANILSFHEFEDNASYIDIRKGWVEKGQEWLVEGRNKQAEINNNLQGYHIEIFYQDKDKRTYRQEFFRKGYQKPTVTEPELILHHRYKPTGLGILLFGKNPRNHYPQAVLKAEARYGKEEPEIHDFSDALVLIPDKVEKWLKRTLSSKINREKFARKTEYSYPIEVLREAIINALMHRDYDIEGAKCYLNIDDDKIVIKSPGLPVKPIRFDDLKELKAPSLSRNPKLMSVFNAMEYVEERGIGMKTMKTLPEKYNLPIPDITWEDPFINISFPRNQNYFESIIGAKTYNLLNDEERKGLVFLRDRKEVSKAEYAKHFGFNDKKAQRHLLKFRKMKLVTTKGQSTATKYIFNAS